MRGRTLAVIALVVAVIAIGVLLLRESDDAADAGAKDAPRVAQGGVRGDGAGERAGGVASVRKPDAPRAPVLHRLPGAEEPPAPPPRLPRAPAAEPGFELTRTGLQVRDDVVGSGPIPRVGQTVVVHYTGWLDDHGKNGRQFDSSHDRGQPIDIPFGKGMVIPGWEQALSTMHAGGKRTVIIPAGLGYGDSGSGDVIPPGATLRFEIELVDVKDPTPP